MLEDIIMRSQIRTYIWALLIVILSAGISFAQDGSPAQGALLPDGVATLPTYDFTQEGYGETFIENYPLGPGDYLKIRVFTLDPFEEDVRISQDGKLILPVLGEIDVAGVTIPELRRKLTSLYRKYYTDLTVSIELIGVKRIQVYVFGNVEDHGIYTIFANTTLLEFLQRLRLTTNSQYRRLVHHRGDEKTVIDPFKFTVYGEIDRNNIYLEFGDRLEVPAPEVAVSLTGRVYRRGVYEVLPGETMLDILNLAGGPEPFADISEAVVERTKPDGRFERIHIDLAAIMEGREIFEFQNRDTLHIPVKEYNVYVLGAVAQPGRYPYVEGKTIEQYIAESGGFIRDAHLSFVTIIRPGPRYGKQVSEKFQVNLKDVLTEKHQHERDRAAFRRDRIPLQPGDIIMVPSKGTEDKTRNLNTIFNYLQNVLQSILIFRR